MTNQVSVTIPQTVYERAKQLASLRQQAVSDLFADALELIEIDHKPNPEKQMAQEEKAYQAMHQQLIANYTGEYVAIYQGKLIDHDANEIALLQRLDANYPHDVVLMRQVLPQPEPELRIRSPAWFVNHNGCKLRI